LRIHLGGELGSTPGPTGAFGLGGAVLWRRWRLELQGTALVPRTVERALGDVRVGLFAGAVHGCRRLGSRALEVPLCLGVEVGAMRGEGRDVLGARKASAPWVAAVLAPGLAWRASRRVSVWASLQVLLTPVRPVFGLTERPETVPLFSPSPVSGRLLAGVEVRFGETP
jgi:hypothetical protein